MFIKALIAIVYIVIAGLVAGLIGNSTHNQTAAGWAFIIALVVGLIAYSLRRRIGSVQYLEVAEAAD
jgi:carbon starvation protein CstA